MVRDGIPPVMAPTDIQLIEKIRDGDTAAFGALYERYIRRIHAFVYYRTHHRETAEDLTSQVFLKAMEGLRTFDKEKGEFSAWLYRIARNAVIDHFRALRPTVDIEDVWGALASDLDIARDAETSERLETVRTHFDRLSAAQREVLTMRLWDGLSHAEIAAITGRTEAASKMAYSRALAALRDLLPTALITILLHKPFL